MSTTKIDYFKHAKEIVEFKAGDTIFAEGDASDGTLYVIREGEVEISYNGKHLENVGTGDILGEMGLVDDSERSATARAVTDSVLVPVKEDRFMFLVHETPTFALMVMRTLADRLRRMNESLE